MQIASYFFFGSSFVSFVLMPALLLPSLEWRIAGNTLYFLTAALLVFFTARTSYADPTDPTVYEERKSRILARPFDSKGYTYHCQICETHVEERTKHCSACNRCVARFDHHCKWINNCVGRQNYRLFATMISCCFLNEVVYCTFSCVFLVFAFRNEPEAADRIEEVYGGGRIVICAVMCSALVVNLIVALLIGHLIGVHIWLTHKGITTYEFLMRAEDDTLRDGSSTKTNTPSREGLSRTQKKTSRIIRKVMPYSGGPPNGGAASSENFRAGPELSQHRSNEDGALSPQRPTPVSQLQHESPPLFSPDAEEIFSGEERKAIDFLRLEHSEFENYSVILNSQPGFNPELSAYGGEFHQDRAYRNAGGVDKSKTPSTES